MTLLLNGVTLVGGAGRDYIFGIYGGVNNHLTGNGGNDLIFGDLGRIFGDLTTNTSIATAFNIFNPLYWFEEDNPLVGDSATPHALLQSEGLVGQAYFAITIGAGETITLDIDFASFDTILDFLDTDGTTVLDTNDDSLITDGGLGSEGFNATQTRDSYLTYTVGVAGTYYIRVKEFGGDNNLEVDDAFLLAISVTNHAVSTPSPGGNDQIFGGDGNDMLFGQIGDDIIEGGAGDDIMDGGAGNDTLSYANYAPASGSTGVAVNVDGGTVSTATAGTDTISGFENIIGSDYQDFLTGNSNANILNGGDGNDILQGTGGDNTLYGGNGDDIFLISHTTTGTSTFDGGAGTNDRLQVIGNTSTIDLRDDTIMDIELFVFQASGSADYTVEMYAAQFTMGSVNSQSHAGQANRIHLFMDTQSTLNLSSVVITGMTEAGDGFTINGDANNETIIGSSINDTINAGDGDDVVVGGAGADILDGGTGIDRADYNGSSAGVFVNLGTGLGFNGDAEGDTLTGFEHLTGSAHDDGLTGSGAAESFFGEAGADTINGNSGNDIINGGDGNDYIQDGFGDDTVNGGAGDDTMIVVYANGDFRSFGDTFDGGDGSDTLQIINYDFHYDNDPVIFDMDAGTFENLGGTNTVTNFENYDSTINAVGGAETIRGTAGANDIKTGLGNDIIEGRAGDDTLNGGDGDDTIEGGLGADTLDGGADIDTLSYASSGAGVTVFFSTGHASGGDAAGDTYTNFENLIGSAFFDNLIGDSNDNIINGGAGNDYLTGQTGVDQIFGGDGHDTIFIDSGDIEAGEIYDGGAGSDILAFSSTVATTYDLRNVTISNIESLYFTDEFVTGLHTIQMNASQFTMTIIQSENDIGQTNVISLFMDSETTLDLSSVFFSIFSESGDGFLITGDSDNEIIIGSIINDTINAGAGNDRLNGGDGDDILYGEDGADTFLGSAGSDANYGGAGLDAVDYRAASSRVILDLGLGGTLGDASGDSYSSIERVYGSDFNDTITGTSGNEFFYGEDGNDTINGGGGIDRIYGGAGNDIQRGQGGNDQLYGSDGSDQLNGGTGFDIANYGNATSLVIVNMASGGTGGDANGDTYFGIEAVYGSDFNDTITGNTSSNELRGKDGNDTLNGGSGNDRLFGGDGADTLNGDAGTDIAMYTNASSGVSLDLATGGYGGDANGDSYASIEWVYGSAHNDTITGDSGNNRILGNDGADTLNGAAGNDRILGGDGDDIIQGGDGVDTIFGQDGNDTLDGNAGNDFFFGSSGGDDMDGGADFDTVSYLGASSGITTNMQTSGTGGDANGDTYVSIERLFGSNFSDNITGSSGDDTLLGLGGDDIITGGTGVDRMFGGAGTDLFAYDSTQDGADQIHDFRGGTLGAEQIAILGSDPDFDTFAEVLAAASQIGNNTVIDFGGGNTLTLINYDIIRFDATAVAFSLPAEAPDTKLSQDQIANALLEAPQESADGNTGEDSMAMTDMDAGLFDMG